jgi:hypothetical protein
MAIRKGRSKQLFLKKIIQNDFVLVFFFLNSPKQHHFILKTQLTNS